jgi:glycerol uptake facilitator-like aquaporin
VTTPIHRKLVAEATGTMFLVAAVIGTAAYWFTSSTSFANPAVTIARMLPDSFAGIAPSSVPLFLLAQAVGGAVGYLLNQSLYPKRRLVSADLLTDEAVGTSQQPPDRGQHEPH